MIPTMAEAITDAKLLQVVSVLPTAHLESTSLKVSHVRTSTHPSIFLHGQILLGTLFKQ